MRVIVTGASGLLGRSVVAKAKAAGHEVKGLAFTRASGDLVKLDLHDSAAFEELCTNFKPDVVCVHRAPMGGWVVQLKRYALGSIHAAAERRPDVAERDSDATRRLNVAVPRSLAQICHRLDIVIVYISTDYVFPGEAPNGGYTPQDQTEPLQLYGETKLAGETEILEHGKPGKAVVLRVPVLYGPVEENSESAVNILIDVVKARKQVKMDDWSPRYPTNVQDVARVLLDIGDLYRNSLDITLPTILHFSSQSKVYSKLDMSNFFASCLGIDNAADFLVPVREGPKEGETRRPRDCHLSNGALEELGIDTREEETFEQWFRRELS